MEGAIPCCVDDTPEGDAPLGFVVGTPVSPKDVLVAISVEEHEENLRAARELVQDIVNAAIKSVEADGRNCIEEHGGAHDEPKGSIALRRVINTARNRSFHLNCRNLN